jgi:hypothetical protein
MNANKTMRPVCLALAATMLVGATIAPGTALAAGTGDDPRPTKDLISAADAPARAAEEAFVTARRGQRAALLSAHGTRGVSAKGYFDNPPYEYLWTTTHPQERTYWCGPASVQTIESYFYGPCHTQAQIAALLGTTTNGTDFTRVDDVLRSITGQTYWYWGPITTWADYTMFLDYGIGWKHHPIAADVTIDGSYWPNYVYDHAGHIVPLEAYDFRVSPYQVRLDDPYDEAHWAGGGATLGHRTYKAYVIWNGLYHHFRHAMVL